MRAILAYVVLLVMVGAWHGYGLSQRGLLEHDEGHNLLAARTHADVIRWVVTGGPLRSSTTELAAMKETLHRQGGTLYPAGKPGYIVLLALASFLTGLTAKAALWISWFAGIVCVAMAGVVARRLFGCALLPQVTVMLGVGLSPLIGYLSREVGGTIWSLAFGMSGMAMLLYSSGIVRTMTGGLLMGYGFTCHYNLLPAIAAAFVLDLFFTASQTHVTLKNALIARARPYASAALGIVIVLGVFQVGSLAAEYKLRPIYPKYQNYFAELIRIVTTYQLPALQGGAVSEGARGWGASAWRYLGLTLLRDTLMFVPAVAAIALALTRRISGGKLLIPAAMFLLANLMFWVAHPWKVERSWGMLSISMWLCAAGLVQLLGVQWQSWTPGAKVLTLASFLGIAVGSLTFAADQWMKLWRARSPMEQVVANTLAYIEQNGGSIHADSAARSFAPLWKWSIVEALRQPDHHAAVQHVNFSAFGNADIIFVDPNTWNDPDFTMLKSRLTASRLIASADSQNPAWTLAAYDTRTTSPH